MSKQITPGELAEIVTGLLLVPEAMGELEGTSMYASFLSGIGSVVAEHCGGEINCVNEPQGECELHLLSVAADGCLPSRERNIWAAYDPDGWEGEDDVICEGGEPYAEHEVEARRSKIIIALAKGTDPELA